MLGMTSLLRTYFDKCPSGLEPSEKNLLSAARNLDNIVVRLTVDGRFDHQRGGARDRLVAADAPIRRADGPGFPGPLGLGLPAVRSGSAPALRTLKELLARFEVGLSDVAFASRMAESPELSESVQTWLEAEARRPEDVGPKDWLRFEQEKHQKLLVAA